MIEVVLTLYLLCVTAGWLNVHPLEWEALKDISPWRYSYQLPVNVFFFLNRTVNYYGVSLIVALCKSKSENRWETISSRVGRDFYNTPIHYFIDILFMDIATDSSGGHCVKYIDY